MHIVGYLGIEGKKRAMNMQQIDPVQMEKQLVITSYLLPLVVVPKVINDAALKKNYNQRI